MARIVCDHVQRSLVSQPLADLTDLGTKWPSYLQGGTARTDI